MSAPAPGGGPWSGRRLHLIGLGGAGMSAYATAAASLGASVTGSDAATSPYLETLERDGEVAAVVGHAAANIPDGDDVEVFYSSAIAEDNVERRAARERGLRERPRADLLAELTALRRTIAVAGTHGKTTTAAMLVAALRGAGLHPSWLVGGAIGPGLANASFGADSEWLVVEADESDRSMLSIEAEIAVVTNVELDHHATFASLEDVREAFRQLLTGPAWAVIWDRPELLALRDGPVAPYDVESLEIVPGGSRFRWRGQQVELKVPGAHNALNATGALEAARLAGADEAAAAAALSAFAGAARRFQPLGATSLGARVYEDYAHHPTEVAATLRAARSLDSQRLVAVFQPHLFSRTARLAREFGDALALADVVVALDVYPAREHAADHPGVSGLLVAEAVADASAGRPVYWLPRLADAAAVLRGVLGAGDVCLVMGAGDVDDLGRELVADGEAA